MEPDNGENESGDDDSNKLIPILAPVVVVLVTVLCGIFIYVHRQRR